MTKYCCNFCDKKFHYNEFYENHRVACEFFSQNRKQNTHQTECQENLPSQDEMFKLLQHLSLKCQTLSEEVDKLKKISLTTVKKTTENKLLNLKPSVTFESWFKSLRANHDCITEVLIMNLTDGIIKCVKQLIDDENSTLPIQSFQDKPGVLYIYEEDNETQLCKWVVCTNDKIQHMVDLTRHEIVKFYCGWKETQPVVDTDTEMHNLCKISGLKINNNKQTHEFKNWLIEYASRYNL